MKNLDRKVTLLCPLCGNDQFESMDEEFEDRGDTVKWTIKKVKLYEVSVVTFPAYEDTSVSARKRQLGEMKKRSIEAWKHKTLKKLKGEA